MFNDSKGRTSPSKVVGFAGCVVALLVFGVASFDAIFTISDAETNNILSTLTMQSLGLFTASAALLGIRRFTKDKDPSIDDGNL